MPETLSAQDAVELAVVDRNGFIESRHVGAAIVLGPDGTTIAEHGNTDALILPRSALKPLQSLAVTLSGVELTGAARALTMASHSGTDRHAAAVLKLLAAGGYTEDDLLCPASWPRDNDTRTTMIQRGDGPARVRMTCSGKHTAMLLACRVNGWDPATYTDLEHPLQVQIRSTIERLAGERVAASAIDGCGAPVYAIRLSALARALHRIGTASDRSPFALHRAGAELVAAVRAYPWAVEGPGMPDTVLAEKLGVFSKFGAEGVMTMIAPDGTTTVVKTLDGSERVGPAVAVSLLAKAGALTPDQREEGLSSLHLAVTGGEAVVGEIRPTV